MAAGQKTTLSPRLPKKTLWRVLFLTLAIVAAGIYQSLFLEMIAPRFTSFYGLRRRPNLSALAVVCRKWSFSLTKNAIPYWRIWVALVGQGDKRSSALLHSFALAAASTVLVHLAAKCLWSCQTRLYNVDGVVVND